MKPTTLLLSTLLIVLALPAPALAQPKAAGHSAHHPAAGASAPADDRADGEVRKVDRDAAKLTLKHAEIKSLDMPPMTMVFTVKDKSMLDKLKSGDRVRFRAENDNGKYTVTEIETVR